MCWFYALADCLCSYLPRTQAVCTNQSLVEKWFFALSYWHTPYLGSLSYLISNLLNQQSLIRPYTSVTSAGLGFIQLTSLLAIFPHLTALGLRLSSTYNKLHIANPPSYWPQWSYCLFVLRFVTCKKFANSLTAYSLPCADNRSLRASCWRDVARVIRTSGDYHGRSYVYK